MKFKWRLMKEKVKDFLSKPAVTIADGGRPCRACFALLQAVERNSDWRTEEKKMLQECYRIVDQWDVRNYRKFVKLFPFVLPKKYRNKVGTVYMDDTPAMDWVIEF